jgi:tagaturonate reductase
MKSLDRSLIKKKELPIKVLQFGDGNFLRAFIDWMFNELNHHIDFNAGITVVKARPGKGKLDILNKQNGLYTLLLNGIKNGELVNDRQIIDCIQKGIHPYENFDQYFEEASNPKLQFLVSNTTEAGIVFDPNNKLTDKPQSSFPGKVTAFLYERFKVFKGDPSKGLIFFPCELIDNNGTKLREIVLKYAEIWQLENEFINWVQEHSVFCNTLVDRIVSGYPKESIDTIQEELEYLDPLLVVGEQYHLFVIEAPQFVQEKFPVDKIGLNVIFTNDIKKYKTIKVRILNGAHTTLVPVSYLYGIDKVGESVANKTVEKFLLDVISKEICPTLDFPKEELQKYTNDVLDRFRNPCIEHELMSISLNSVSKYKARILPSVLEYIKRKNKLPKGLLFSLAAMIAFYKGDRNGEVIDLKDVKEILDFFATQWSTGNFESVTKATLSNTDFWGIDLTQINGIEKEVSLHLDTIITNGMKSALETFTNYDH